LLAARPPYRPNSVWKVLPYRNSDCESLAKNLSIHPVVARMLSARGWIAAGEDANHFVDPKLRQLRDPFELADMEVAAERTARAIAAKEKVCIYGDYDVDGVTSTALMAGLLRYLGSDPLIVIPHRIRDGYGMNRARVEKIARSGCTLILTVDNGISAAEEIALANELGIDVVVTDHHQARGELPAATALVNPNRPDFHYEHGSLCGVGVAFKFAHALLKTLKHPEAEARCFLMSQMDLVTLGTIADVVPLLGENRVLVRHGLTALAETKRVGLQELIEISGIANKGFHPESVAFGLAPRINAAGRTGDAKAVPFLLASRLVALGTDHHSGNDFEPFALRDGNLVTGQNPQSAEKVAQMVLDALDDAKQAA